MAELAGEEAAVAAADEAGSEIAAELAGEEATAAAAADELAGSEIAAELAWEEAAVAATTAEIAGDRPRRRGRKRQSRASASLLRRADKAVGELLVRAEGSGEDIPRRSRP